jgi:hypothetical protein
MKRSSETTREDSNTNPFMYDFSEYIHTYMPQHKTSIDPKFISWFIGFFEGDGTISQWHTQNTPKTEPANRFQISLEQKNNLRLLKSIRTTLGFGKVTTHARGSTYRVGKKEDIIRLLILFHGNLTLTHRRQQLDEILDTMLLAGWDLPKSLHRRNLACIPPSLETGWMSGFFDADAGFYSNRGRDFESADRLSDGALRLRIQLKFYVTQKVEDQGTLEQIGELFSPNGWSLSLVTSSHSQTKYARLEINRGSGHDALLLYLVEHPLKGTRRIDVKIFELLRRRQLQRGSRPETAKMARRTARLLEKFSKSRQLRDGGEQ